MSTFKQKNKEHENAIKSLIEAIGILEKHIIDLHIRVVQLENAYMEEKLLGKNEQ